MRITAYLLVLLAVLTASPASLAEESSASYDFKFMELRQQLREHPDHPDARHWIFAIGEYYFRQHDLAAAGQYFNRFKPQMGRNAEELLAAVYLLLSTEDPKTASALTRKLQEALSDKPFFAAFHASKVQAWRSPLGNHFDLKEEVDRLEIKLNGKPFYTIDLS